MLNITVWDVQHGSATYIKTPNGTHIVQDLGMGSHGERDELFSPLLHLKNKYKVLQLDYVLITHPHKDHILDIMNFDKLTPRVLCRPKHLSKDEIMKDVKDEDKKLFEKYFEISNKYSEPVSEESNPELPKNNGGVVFKRFHPTSCSTSNINNHSIVNVINYANSKIVLTGDNEPPSWKELMDINDFQTSVKNADILLAPHHGRDSGYYSEIMSLINPKLTIISDNKEVDTSATDRYSKLSRGYYVYNRETKEAEKRYCITTRSDGVINITSWYDKDNKPLLLVQIK